MGHEADRDRVWEMMEKIGICMLASRDGDKLRARPMAAFVSRNEHAVYFLTDADSHKDVEIEKDSAVALAFADSSGQNYLSVSGRASVSRDRDKVEELWSTPAKAWWDDPDDPSIRVLKVVLEDAQYWDGPGTVMATIKMTAAAVSDKKPDMGDNAKVTM